MNHNNRLKIVIIHCVKIQQIKKLNLKEMTQYIFVRNVQNYIIKEIFVIFVNKYYYYFKTIGLWFI